MRPLCLCCFPRTQTRSQPLLPTALGVAQLVESGKPDTNYFAGLAQHLGIGYTSCIISLNIITSGLVAGRIFVTGRVFAERMGRDAVAAYSGAAAIIVESSALSTVTGIAYLVTFARNGQLEIFFLSIYVMMTVRAALSRSVAFRSRADGLSRGISALRRS